jgi:hypothetical protein
MAKDPRNNIPKANLILLVRSPLQKRATPLGLREDIFKKSKPNPCCLPDARENPLLTHTHPFTPQIAR